MREIKFRGKSVEAGEWVYGDLEQYEDVRFIMNHNTGLLCTKVDPKTVGQFTGLHDKNGLEIYEGDRLAHDDDFKQSGVVQFALGMFGINWDYDKNGDPEWKDGAMYGGWGQEHNLRRMDDGFAREMVVIGNIHENATGDV